METPRKVDRPVLKRRSADPVPSPDPALTKAKLVPVCGVQTIENLLICEGVNGDCDRRIRVEVERYLESDPIFSVTSIDESDGRTVAHLRFPLSKIKHLLASLTL